MVFWRKQKNPGAAEEEARDQTLLHPEGEPALEPGMDYDTDIDPEAARALDPTETEMLEDMLETPLPCLPTIEAAEGEGWLSRLASGLSKSAGRLAQGIADLVTKRPLDAPALAALEDVLIQADCGPAVAAQIIKAFSAGRFGQEVGEEEVRATLAAEIEKILAPVAKPLVCTRPEGGGPFVFLMCGVNGAGKTTTAGKLAHHLVFKDKRRVMLAACDTFRAAAVEQLAAWAGRAHCPMVRGEIGADAAAVAFQAYEGARTADKDVLIIDTAGRLQNKANLMAELGKIVRVLQKHDPAAPHACLLVLDGTSGQNAHAQVEVFGQVVSLSGLVVTKLDGAAKGGVVVALAQRFGVPIPLVGVGEGAEDLQTFAPSDYARALVGLPAA